MIWLKGIPSSGPSLGGEGKAWADTKVRPSNHSFTRALYRGEVKKRKVEVFPRKDEGDQENPPYPIIASRSRARRA